MSGIANQVQATVIYCAEGTFGVAATANNVNAKTLRRVTTSLAPGKDMYQSNEARPDLQLADMRHGTLKPGGGIQGELCNVAYDDLLEALMRGTWTTGLSVPAATYTTLTFANTSGTPLAAGSLGTIAFTAGNPQTLGFKIGDIVRPTGASFGANAGVNFRITSVLSNLLQVSPSPAVLAAQAGTNIAVVGKKLTMGTVKRSFTVEQQFPDVTVSELFTGMRVNSGAINLAPNGLATVSFAFMGQNCVACDSGTTPASPYFTAPVAIGTNGLLAGPQGNLRFNGIEQGVITSYSVNVDNNCDAPPVVGTVLVPDIFYGGIRVSGSVSFFLQDKSLLNVFNNEVEADLTVFMPANMAAPQDFLCINMQRIKLGGATKTVGASSGVVVTCPYTALLPTSATDPWADLSTMTIQRSN